jgi:MYXO-CTERM domain-containing protein
MPRRLLHAAVLLASLLAAAPAGAADYTLSPGVTQAQVAAQLDKLQPGDTLTLMPGDYMGIDLDLMHADMSGIAGTATAPIVITGMPDGSGALPHVVADTDNYQEAVRLRPGCAFVTIQNLHLSAVGGQTQAGIFVDSGVNNITVTGNVIENVTGIGIQIQTQSDVHDFLVEHNAIYDTGTNTGDGNNGGQAFTAGGFDPSTATTNVYNLVVRGNLVHDNKGQEGDCLKFMYGVFASRFEDNVMYNCPRGVSGETENYGITSYGSGVGHYTKAADDNIVQRNLVIGTAATQSGHDNVAIYVGPGTLVMNNVILQSDQGIAARLESEASEMRNLSVVNNTVYGATDNAFSIRGCSQADSSVVVTSNAFLAVQASGFGYRMPDPIGSMIATANYYEGQDYAEAPPPVMNKLTAPASALFVSPSMKVPGADFMLAPGSPLVDKGDAKTAPMDDFDLAMRPAGNGPDVGAYELRPDLSDHWALALAFKGSVAMGGLPDAGGLGTGGAGGGSSGSSGAQGGGGSGAGGKSGGCKCATPGAPAGPAAAPAIAMAALIGAMRRRRRVSPGAARA